MQNRVPVPRAERPDLPDFAPVPRRFRHDGWTPARQKAFIEALADTGCVSRAARMVNMAQANCYALRRAPGAEAFRRAWDAALDFGLQRLKDIAFERAIEGQLVPVFVGGKLFGYRRRRNDALLMFCLRHYGQDGEGRRTTINYFSTRASASAGAGAATEGAAGAAAESATTTVRTVMNGRRAAGRGEEREEEAADALAGFAGVTLDPQAEAAIKAALEDCAARQRAADDAIDAGGDEGIEAQVDDPDIDYLDARNLIVPYLGELEPPARLEDAQPFVEGEAHWRLAGAEIPWAVADEAGG